MIDPQIIFNKEKLIDTIYKSIRIININKYTDTYPHDMGSEEFTNQYTW
jgi:hypothetical protein